MDISINSRHPSVTDPATLQNAPATEATKKTDRPALVITEARADSVSGLDATEEIPDAALRRDDPLGRLLSSVFTLPAPPMPAFPS